MFYQNLERNLKYTKLSAWNSIKSLLCDFLGKEGGKLTQKLSRSATELSEVRMPAVIGKPLVTIMP
jgi:hypothetical protein